MSVKLQIKRAYQPPDPADGFRVLSTGCVHPVTLVYGARDERHNQAVALRRYLQQEDPG